MPPSRGEGYHVLDQLRYERRWAYMVEIDGIAHRFWAMRRYPDPDVYDIHRYPGPAIPTARAQRASVLWL